MSIRVIQWVWDHSTAEGLDRLVLLAIADSANHDGGGAFPGKKELHTKTRLGYSTLFKCLKRLKAEGHIEVQTAGGDGRGKRTVYRVVMDVPTLPDDPPTLDDLKESTPDTLNGTSTIGSTPDTHSYPQGDVKGPPGTRKGPPGGVLGSTPVALTSNNANNRPYPSLPLARAGAQGRPRTPNRPTAGRCPHDNPPAECWQCPRPLGAPAPTSLAEALRRGKLNGGAA